VDLGRRQAVVDSSQHFLKWGGAGAMGGRVKSVSGPTGGPRRRVAPASRPTGGQLNEVRGWAVDKGWAVAGDERATAASGFGMARAR
jgi:hypothetical protein